jgi:hypothetical protein
MIALFFRNIFFICFFISIFTTDGFSARKVFPDHIKAKVSFLTSIFLEGISGSDIFKDFALANIEKISLRYRFLPIEYLKKTYTTEKGFSSDFVEDAVRGFTSEKDSLHLLKVIYNSYQNDMNELGQQSKRSFPRIIEFVPNTESFFQILAGFGLSDNPPYNLGLYCVSAVYKESNDVRLELLQSLLKNSLRFKSKQKSLFLGDKQNLKDMILQGGLVKSSLMKNFILGNNIDNIHFYFNFQSVEDLIYTLRSTEISEEVIKSILCSDNDITHHEFFAKEASELFDSKYRTTYYSICHQVMHYLTKNKSVDIIVAGLVEIFINTEYVRQTLNDDQQIVKGVYFVFAGLACDFDQMDRLLSYMYVPYCTDNRMQDFKNYDKKNILVRTMKSSGIAGSSIFKEFVEKNGLENVFFNFMFIPKSTLENIFPCGIGDCPCVDDFVSGNINKSNRIFLKKELYFNYFVDFKVWKKSGFSMSLRPVVAELLNKNPDTTALLNNDSNDLESEQGIYLVRAFFGGANGDPFYPKRRKPPENWIPHHRVRMMAKLFPFLDEGIEDLGSVY